MIDGVVCFFDVVDVWVFCVEVFEYVDVDFDVILVGD